MLDFPDYGETDCTAQLCGACHDLVHVMVACYLSKSRSAIRLVGELGLREGLNNPRILSARRLVEEQRTLRIKAIRKILKAMEQGEMEKAQKGTC
jgi:hypothetical protein